MLIVFLYFQSDTLLLRDILALVFVSLRVPVILLNGAMTAFTCITFSHRDVKLGDEQWSRLGGLYSWDFNVSFIFVTQFWFPEQWLDVLWHSPLVIGRAFSFSRGMS